MSTAVERILGTVLDELLGCLCAALAQTPKGAPCFCGMVGGRQAIADQCGCDKDACGMAWVRVERIYGYEGSVATPARLPRCATPLAAVIEVGVYRCIPTADGSGSGPSAVQQIDQVLGQVADAGAMAAAIKCCTAITTRDHVLGTYLPRDSGDCGGGVWPVTVALSEAVPDAQRSTTRRSS